MVDPPAKTHLWSRVKPRPGTKGSFYPGWWLDSGPKGGGFCLGSSHNPGPKTLWSRVLASAGTKAPLRLLQHLGTFLDLARSTATAVSSSPSCLLAPRRHPHSPAPYFFCTVIPKRRHRPLVEHALPLPPNPARRPPSTCSLYQKEPKCSLYQANAVGVGLKMQFGPALKMLDAAVIVSV